MTTTTLTKQDLQTELEKFEKRMDKKFATKNDLKHEIADTKEVLVSLIQSVDEQSRVRDKELKDELHIVEDRLNEKLNRMMNSIDFLVKEAETAQEDRVLGTAQLRDHEVRITKLEQGNN